MKLSIVSIAFNNLLGLKKTLAVFELYGVPEDTELVIVDGGSTDGTLDYLRTQEYCTNWVSEKDKGIYNAMNKGLKMAKGEYVWFLNSGDYVEHYETITRILNALKDNADAYYGETMMVDLSGHKLGTRSEFTTRPLPENLNWKSFRLGMNVSHQSFIVRKNKAVDYDEHYHFVADIDWMIRTLKGCKTVVNLHFVIACFTMDGFSSRNRSSSNRERFNVLRKHYGFIPNILAHFGIVIRKVFGFGKY